MFSSINSVGEGKLKFVFNSPNYTKPFAIPVMILPPKTIAPNEVILGRNFLATNKFDIQFAPDHQEKMFHDEFEIPIEQMRLN